MTIQEKVKQTNFEQFIDHSADPGMLKENPDLIKDIINQRLRIFYRDFEVFTKALKVSEITVDDLRTLLLENYFENMLSDEGKNLLGIPVE